MKKTFLFLVLAFMMSLNVYAQQTLYEAKQPPKATEVIIGTIKEDFYGGITYTTKAKYHTYYSQDFSGDRRESISEEVLYNSLYKKAKDLYGKTHPNFTLRNFMSSGLTHQRETSSENEKYITTLQHYIYPVSATVVTIDPKIEAAETFSNSIEKALRNVHQGSRIAIDQVVVTDGRNREDCRDEIINVLLEKGYKVVAKEYLEKLYEEQQKQQSGIYNNNTTVQNNNFSAVGYFISVKVTKESLRVQVVNVSTGEYEGNVFNSKQGDKSVALLSQTIGKALQNIREGSRVALDQVTVWSGINREDYKDQVIDALLNKGYKVVAKEYLEKLYEEQQKQQSGIYNDRTVVQDNNFSAVGYFINVKVTETSLRVQAINVSTGEYEGTATTNY